MYVYALLLCMLVTAFQASDARSLQELDAIDGQLRGNLDAQRAAYKDSIGRLKDLKSEYEHLQHQVNTTKVKIMQEFNDLGSGGLLRSVVGVNVLTRPPDQQTTSPAPPAMLPPIGR